MKSWNVPCFPQMIFSKKELEDYENIIFGGCVQAGGIMGFDLIKKNMDVWRERSW